MGRRVGGAGEERKEEREMGGMRRCLLVGTLLGLGLCLAALGSAWAGGGEEEIAGVQELRESPGRFDVGGKSLLELNRERLSA